MNNVHIYIKVASNRFCSTDKHIIDTIERAAMDRQYCFTYCGQQGVAIEIFLNNNIEGFITWRIEESKDGVFINLN